MSLFSPGREGKVGNSISCEEKSSGAFAACLTESGILYSVIVKV